MSQDALPVSALLVLADRHPELEHERRKIADAGMNWIHQEYNCVNIAGYILELVEKGRYSAPWTDGRLNS